MNGRITTRHLVLNAKDIIQGFGLRTYVLAWVVAIRGGTFLEAVRLGMA
jgi:hypothetical protein